MVFEAGARDLPLVVEGFRANEADNAVDQERVERAGHAVGPCLQRQLIDAVMRLRRQGAALARLEVHHLLADPGDVPAAVSLEDTLAALAELGETDPETAVGRLRAGNRL